MRQSTAESTWTPPFSPLRRRALAGERAAYDLGAARQALITGCIEELTHNLRSLEQARDVGPFVGRAYRTGKSDSYISPHRLGARQPEDLGPLTVARGYQGPPANLAAVELYPQ